MARKNKIVLMVALAVLLGLIGFLVWWFFVPVNYYEYYAESSDDCVPGEQYDSEYGVCYFDFSCDTEQQCADVEKEFQPVLESLTEAEDDVGGDESLDNGPTFDITDGEITGTAQNRLQRYDHIWGIARLVIPDEYMQYIAEFGVYRRPLSSTMAFVVPASDDLDQWRLRINTAGLYGREGALRNPHEFFSTLVHEFAHIVALNNTQVDAEISDTASCVPDYFLLDEGCLRDDSYLAAFTDQFWVDTYSDYAAQADRRRFDYYTNYPEDFSTEYAGTNPVEDIAESFAFFVLMTDPPVGDTLAEQKINFFYEYPELVQIREHMRSRVASVLNR